MLLTELPIYMKTILHFDTRSNALLSALPYLVMWMFSIVISQVADWLNRQKIATITTIRKAANTISHGGPAVCLIAVAYAGCDPFVTMVLLTLAVGLQGAVYSGYMVNHLDIAPNFAGIIFGITSSFATIPSWVAPLTVATLTKGQQTLGQWRIAFLLTAGILLFDCVVFLMFGSGEEQPWNRRAKFRSTPYTSQRSTEGGAKEPAARVNTYPVNIFNRYEV